MCYPLYLDDSHVRHRWCPFLPSKWGGKEGIYGKDKRDGIVSRLQAEELLGLLLCITIISEYLLTLFLNSKHIDNGVHDQIEHYSSTSPRVASYHWGYKRYVFVRSANRDVANRTHPTALRPFLPEIRGFSKFNHAHVLHEILRLLALGMELPEDTFVKIHGFEAVGESNGECL